jgi:hypothetical protein
MDLHTMRPLLPPFSLPRHLPGPAVPFIALGVLSGLLWCTPLPGSLGTGEAAAQERPAPQVGDSTVLELPAEGVAVLGLVGDFITGEPVVGAFVRVDGEVKAVTDQDGRFEVVLSPGFRQLDVRRSGYRARVAGFALDDTPLVRMNVALDPIAYALPEVVVQGERTRLVFGTHRGFYQRMREANGHFITRDQIEQRAPRAVSDLLRLIPGLEVVQSGVNPAQVRVSHARGLCGEPVIFLDGVEVDVGSPDLLMPPEHIEGIEVYTRPITVPLEFSKQGSFCGVIAIWSR